MSNSQLSPGTVVDGKYTVGAAIRTRPGITTYDATDAAGAAVSVTIYERTCFASGLALERSLRELRQLKNVVSTRVLKVHAAGKHGDGIFEVTEPAPPQTLSEHLRSGALSLEEAAALVVQVGESLLEAQRVGVIHRNLGADVVFPSPEGVRVGHFAVGEPQPRGAGPLRTMAPEQVQGKVVDQRTLIYNVAALMQWMLTGAPLFSGSPEEVLAAHEQQVPAESIDAKLRRALGKDPRMRPMMLKQFLHDIAQMGGVEPPKLAARVSAPSVAAPKAPIAAPKAPSADGAKARPSSRGWTMFMQAQDDEPEAKPEPAPAPSKPSTRGWTMFMQAQDDGAAKAEPAAEAPAPKPEAKPQVKAAAAPEAPAPEGKPSTRGWTMFMQAQDDGAAKETEPASASEPAAAPEPAPAEPDAPEAGSPSTRGWTMFTKDEDDAPATEAPAAEPPPAEADAPSPAQAPAAEKPSSGPAQSPSSRGWTMFMGPNDKAPEGGQPEAAPAPAPAPAPESASASDVSRKMCSEGGNQLSPSCCSWITLSAWSTLRMRSVTSASCMAHTSRKRAVSAASKW
ncbi:MAG: hypothetical protein AAGA54_34140, partial [Myxococcota bacterium]